jgi:hypothetical protein
MRSGYDVEENVMLRSVSGWDAATAANQLARNFGRVARGVSREAPRVELVFTLQAVVIILGS